MQTITPGVESEDPQETAGPAANPPVTTPHSSTYASAGAATLALFGGLAGVLIGWLMGASPRSIPGQGTLAGADLLSTTLVAGLFGAGIGALVGALWGLNIPRQIQPEGMALHEGESLEHSERVVPLDYPVISPTIVPAPVVAQQSVSEDLQTQAAADEEHERRGSVPEGPVENQLMRQDIGFSLGTGAQSIDQTPMILNPESGYPLGDPIPKLDEEAAMDDKPKDQMGHDPDSVTGTKGAFDPETGAYGTAGTPVTTGYGVSGSTIGTGSRQVRDEHEAGDFAGSTPDSASYEMGGRGSDDTPTPSSPDDSSDTPVTEKNKGLATTQAQVQSDPATQDLYEAGPSYGPGVGQGKEPSANVGTSRNSDASLDSPPSDRLINSQETDASAGTNIAGTSDPRGLGDNTDET